MKNTDVWSWICDLPISSDRAQSKPPLFTYQLTNSNQTSQSIQLKAEVASSTDKETSSITFSIQVHGSHFDDAIKALWVSNPCPLSADQPYVPLILQLILETLDKAPTTPWARTQFPRLSPGSIVWILETYAPESFSPFFVLLLILRLFFLCACDAPNDIGSLYFHYVLAPNINLFSRANQVPVMKSFLHAIGADFELCIARAIGYMLAKWLIVREMQVGLHCLTQLPSNVGLSYATETHGLWVLKSYTPVWSMKCTRSKNKLVYPFVEAKEMGLRYALAHQQLEGVVQFEYSVRFHEAHIQVSTRVDNLRFHVIKLGFRQNEDEDNDVGFKDEVYFPSRVRVWVGPELGSNYINGLSLAKSTDNTEREMKTQRIVKGSFGKTKTLKIKAMEKTSTRVKMRNWRWDQDVQGNMVIFDAFLCDTKSGVEAYDMKFEDGSVFRRRYAGAKRPFMKSGGVVLAGDQYGQEVKWRLGKEMEGSVLKWRIGAKIWLSYWPCSVNSSYYETRCIELCDEVDLPLIPSM